MRKSIINSYYVPIYRRAYALGMPLLNVLKLCCCVATVLFWTLTEQIYSTLNLFNYEKGLDLVLLCVQLAKGLKLTFDSSFSPNTG